MDLTDDVQLIKRCISADTAALCNQGCQWRVGTTKPTTPTTPSKVEGFCLFTRSISASDISSSATTAASAIADVTSALKNGVTTTGINAPAADVFATGVKDEPCSVIKELHTCDNTATCSWVNVPSRPTPSNETALFTKEFCHPADFKDATVADYGMCLSKSDSTICELAIKCKWSNGTAMIPDHDFCAPADITDDV